MKYLYRNVKTGEVVETSTKVSGVNWEPFEQEELDPAEQKPEKENPVDPEQENPVEQEPEQPKPRRKK